MKPIISPVYKKSINIINSNPQLEEALEIWQNKIYSKYRNSLIKGKRKLSPCNKCNADGTLHGANHANAWMSKTKK